jgi:hypothetical protein
MFLMMYFWIGHRRGIPNVGTHPIPFPFHAPKIGESFTPSKMQAALASAQLLV